MDEGEVFRIVKSSVTNLIFVYPEIVMQEHPDVACFVSLIV
jgi:hypothetical protein